MIRQKTKVWQDKLNLGVSGATGAGKTTFSRSLYDRSGGRLIAESLPLRLLARFGKKPKQVAFDLQRRIVLGKKELYRTVVEDCLCVLDRTVTEDRHIFFSLYERLGFLSSRQRKGLETLVQEAEQIIGPTDAVVIMRAKQEVLVRRMEAARTPRILIETLDQQLALYEEWFSKLQVPCVIIDTTEMSPEDLIVHAAWVFETLYGVKNGQLPENKSLSLRWRRRYGNEKS